MDFLCRNATPVSFVICYNFYTAEAPYKVWYQNMILHIDGLVQERRNSIANALELRLSCTNPSI